MRLLLSQKNELFKIIEDSGFLTPAQFYLSEPQNNDKRSVSINFKNSEYIFNIFEDRNYVKAVYVNYIPGKDAYKEISSFIAWSEIVNHFQQWINNVSSELNEPNYWDSLEQEISTINFSNNFKKSKFTEREFEELKSKVELLSQNINSIPFLVEQNKEIKRELERLTELAKDLGKVDWLNLFVGTIINIIIQLSVSKENSEMLWILIKKVFSTYLILK